MSKGTNTNTVVQQSQPPAQFLQAYSAAQTAAQNVAATPYTPYPYETVAPFTPDQANSFSQVENLTANGGVQTPYLQSAQQDITNATTPLWGETAQFSPTGVQQYESPYTQNVLQTTEAAEANTDQQQLEQVQGSAAGQGAFGGDRAAVAQGITAGQQAVANNATNAGIENQGYTQALGEFNTQQQAQLGANEANAWLSSQAGAGEANLGSEAQATGLQGASALLQTGGLEQQEGQENLNVPYEQYLAAQAYPFQTTGWEAGIAEGLGSSAGGTSTTTSPGPSEVSQIAGLGLGGLGVVGSTGGFGANGWLSSLGGGAGLDTALTAGGESAAVLGGSGAIDAGAFDLADAGAAAAVKRGGAIHRDTGGMIPAAQTLGPGMTPNVPNVSVNIVPTATQGHGSGPPRAPQPYQQPSMAAELQPLEAGAKAFHEMTAAHGGMVPHYDDGGTVDQTPPWLSAILAENLDNQVTSALGGTPMGAAPPVPPTPPDAGQSDQTGMAHGGMIPHAESGMSISQESPWWTRQEEEQSVDRHGLLASPIAGRTDHIAISPAAGSYVIPADVVSGLGEGNTLAGANVMQRILDTGPHGLTMNHERMGKGPPRPPPAYREGEGDDGMAAGGGLQGFDDGGDVWDDSPAADTHGPGLPPSTQTADDLWDIPPSGGLQPQVAMKDTPVERAVHMNESSGSMKPGITGDNGAAGGPMQVHEAALTDVNQHLGTHYTPKQLVDDPKIGKLVGDTYLQMQQDRFHDPALAMGAYNAGPGRMQAAIDSGAGVSGLPASTQSYIARGMHTAGLAPSSPPPSGGMEPASGGTGEPSMHGPGRYTPQEIKPDPWLALAQAGFGMAAGRSPHALENIGAGAERGVASYEQQKQADAQRNLQAQQLAAQREDTAAWRQGMLANTENRNDTYAQRVQGQTAVGQQNADTSLLRVNNAAAYQQRVADLKAQGLDEKTANDQARVELGQGRLGVAQQNADSNATRAATGQQNADTTAAYRQRVTDLQARGMDLKSAQVQANQEIQQGRLGVAQQNADTAANRATTAADQGQQRIDISRMSTDQRAQAFSEHVREFEANQGRQMTAAENSQALRLYGLSRDPITGKSSLPMPKMTPFAQPPSVAAPVAPPTATPPAVPPPASRPPLSAIFGP